MPKYYQGMYNLICRKVEEIFPLLDEYNIEFWGYNPLAGGLLTGKYSNEVLEQSSLTSRFKGNSIYQNIFWKEPIIKKLSSDFFIYDQLTCSEYSFQWLSRYSKMRINDKIIIGASSVEQCKQNMKYIQHPILNYNHDILNKLNNIYTDIELWSPNYFY
jgi:aflatoxin B1 aldehyde reductase